jgi:hypothetical protein
MGVDSCAASHDLQEEARLVPDRLCVDQVMSEKQALCS